VGRWSRTNFSAMPWRCNPRVVFIITDANQNGVKGVAITAACTTGTLDVYSGTTAATELLPVNQMRRPRWVRMRTATCGADEFTLTISPPTPAAMVNGVGGDPSVFGLTNRAVSPMRLPLLKRQAF